MRTIDVALIQFDAVPEQPARNLREMARLAEEATTGGAHWIMFHEGTLTDYTTRLAELAENVPAGTGTKFVSDLARRLNVFISFGLSECDAGRFFITQVFVGPQGFIHKYRKSWLWREPSDEGHRNEWIRYDTGEGPTRFRLDDVDVTCFICADGEAPRCIERAKATKPQVVFYPNNRGSLPSIEVFGERAREIGAPMLVTNRTGQSGPYKCQGGCVVYGPDGAVLAKANREGREEILRYRLHV